MWPNISRTFYPVNIIRKFLTRLPVEKRFRLIGLFTDHLSFDLVSAAKIQKIPNLRKVGSHYGGWIIPIDFISDDSICYCVGVGEDITFDLSLISRFGCHVYAFDPTPRAIKYAQEHGCGVARFHFSGIGVWDEDQVLRFWGPSNPTHVSHSALNLQKTNEFIEAPCNRLFTIMGENGHGQIDLLKLDIEGAEYRVIDSIVKDNLNIGIVCVEYDEAYNELDNRYLERINRSVTQLCNYGYTIVALEPRCNYTFVKRSLLRIKGYR